MLAYSLAYNVGNTSNDKSATSNSYAHSHIYITEWIIIPRKFFKYLQGASYLHTVITMSSNDKHVERRWILLLVRS